MFVGRHLLGDGESAELEAGGAADGVGGDDVAGEIADDQAKGIAFDAEVESGSAEADRGGILQRLNVDRLGASGGEDRPRCVLRERAWSDADAEDVWAERSDPQGRGAGVEFDAVALCLGTDDGVECHSGLRSGLGGGERGS